METIKDLFKSIYDSYTDRIKSPLIGSFILSFFFFNWRLFAMLFYSEWPINCRIEWIEQNYLKTSNFVWPLGISLFYILFLPYINLLIEYFLKYYSKKKYEKKKESRMADLQRDKEEAALIKEISDARAGTSQIDELNERNKALMQENSDLIEQNRSDLERHASQIDQYKKKEIELDKEIAQLNGRLVKPNITEKGGKLKEGVPQEFVMGITNAHRVLEENEKITFYQHFGSQKNKDKISVLTTEMMYKFESLKLVKITQVEDLSEIMALTDLGRRFITHLEDTGYDLL